MFNRHPSTELRVTVSLKPNVSLSLSKTDERMFEVSKELSVTLRLALSVTLGNCHPSTGLRVTVSLKLFVRLS